MAKEKKDLWFKDGLQFECQPGCRRCCGGAPGDVWVTEEEIASIAAYKSMKPEDFEAEFVRRKASGRASLIERSNYDCILLDEHGCSVYSARPQQCRDYPFWPEITKNKTTWKNEKPHCPGIGEGCINSADKITKILKSQEGNDNELHSL